VLPQVVPDQRANKVPFDQRQETPAVEPVGKSPLGSRVGSKGTGAAAGEKQGILLVTAKVV
jgi:hypothetical protein